MWRGNLFKSSISLTFVGALVSATACGDDPAISTGDRGKGGSPGKAGAGGSSAGAVTGGTGGAVVTGGVAGVGVSGSSPGGASGSGGVAGSAGTGGSGGDAIGGEGGEGGLGGEGGEAGTMMGGMGGAGMGGKGGAGAGGAGAGGAGAGGKGGAGAGGAGAGGAGAGGKGGAGAGGAGAGGAGAGGKGGAGAGGAGAGGTGGTQNAPSLYFSEYIEGSGTGSDAFEVYNAGTTPVSLVGCEIRVHYGAAAASTAVTLMGTLNAGDVYVLCLSRISTACDAVTGGLMDLSGDDAVELACTVGTNSVTLDVIGQYGAGLDPGMEWGGMGMNPSTQDQTLRKRCSVTTGDRNATNAFDPNTDYRGFAVDNVSGLGARTCPCVATDLTCP